MNVKWIQGILHTYWKRLRASTIKPNDSEDLLNDYIAPSEWTIITSGLGENDVRRGNFYLLYNGDYLKVSQISDLEMREISICQELWTSIPMWETQTENNALSIPYLLAASIEPGKGKGLMIRLGDYCQGVELLDDWGLHVERWKESQLKEEVKSG